MPNTNSIDSLPTPLIDVAIIGGGVSGAYAAYRLMTEANSSPTLQHLLQLSGKDRLDIRLFELSDRIGGRLWSYHFPGLFQYPAELGGMCFNQLQQNVYGLCTQELGLDTCACECFTTINLQYLRRHRFSFDQYNPKPEKQSRNYYPGTIPYFLTKEEKWKNPVELVIDALEQAIPGTMQLIKNIQSAVNPPRAATLNEPISRHRIQQALKSIQELIMFMRQARVSGKPLSEFGFWNLLADKLSIEAYQLALQATGFYTTYGNWNLYDSFLGFLDFCLQQSYWKLENGYDELPRKLIEKFTELGGSVYLQKQLYGLQLGEYNSEQLMTLTVGPPNVPESVVHARYVVLALPQRALQRLDPDSFIFQNSQFKADLNTVTALPASKLFLVYDQPWWKGVHYGPDQKNITAGQSTTDLPLRTCYYIGAEDNDVSLLLASSNDGIATQFWNGYLQASRSGPHNAPYVGNRGGEIHQDLLAPSDMVREAQRQLAEMHRCHIPDPVMALYHNWMDDPFGGGWHFWNPHVQSWEIMPRIRQPIPGINIFLCGEAYSARQGWVEGALNTAEMVLETHFGLSRPNWASPDYDFGP